MIIILYNYAYLLSWLFILYLTSNVNSPFKFLNGSSSACRALSGPAFSALASIYATHAAYWAHIHGILAAWPSRRLRMRRFASAIAAVIWFDANGAIARLAAAATVPRFLVRSFFFDATVVFTLLVDSLLRRPWIVIYIFIDQSMIVL